MRPLTSQTSPQAGRASVTRLLPLFLSLSLSSRASTPIPLLHVQSHSPPNHSRQADLLSAGAWINIVDGTNIVNLLEEWSRLNSISADNAVGERRSETVPLCWKSSVLERLLALTKGRCRVLPSLMSKCRLKIRLQLSFFPVFFICYPKKKRKVYSPNGIGNHRSSSHWSDSRSVITRPALHPLSFCQSHSVTLLILYVTTLTLFWLDALNVHCVVALQIAHDSLPIRAFVSYLWVGIWYALKINCFIL